MAKIERLVGTSETPKDSKLKARILEEGEVDELEEEGRVEREKATK